MENTRHVKRGGYLMVEWRIRSDNKLRKLKLPVRLFKDDVYLGTIEKMSKGRYIFILRAKVFDKYDLVDLCDFFQWKIEGYNYEVKQYD